MNRTFAFAILHAIALAAALPAGTTAGVPQAIDRRWDECKDDTLFDLGKLISQVFNDGILLFAGVGAITPVFKDYRRQSQVGSGITAEQRISADRHPVFDTRCILVNLVQLLHHGNGPLLGRRFR